MSNFSTEFVKSLYLDEKKFNELMRVQLEEAVNALLAAELDGFLGYEKYSYDGRNSGDSRNGTYERTIDSQFGELHITVPRDRNGAFKQKTIPEYARKTDALEQTVIQLYSHGVTTGEIADIIEKMYGHHYSRATVSNITEVMTDLVERFHNRPVNDKYAVIYCDATYLHLRRDSVEPEALHVILGITPDGHKEVLDYGLYPSESALNYREILKNLKERGLGQVLLFVSDGLNGLQNSISEVFPKSQYQSCWVHLCRNVMRIVRKKDRAEVMSFLKQVYTQENEENARDVLDAFIDTYSHKYPKLKNLFEDKGNLFTFYRFPKEIRKSIYTTNLIERSNKYLKSGYRKKEQFPNEAALERYVATVYTDYNGRYMDLRHHGFGSVEAELLDRFD